MNTEQVRTFLALVDKAIAIRDSDIAWTTKYDLIFSLEICGAITNTGIAITFHDPDTSYEEDTRAYVAAIEEEAVELRRVLPLLELTASPA